MNIVTQIFWMVLVIGLLHLSSLFVLVMWIEYGFSRQSLGVLVSLLIIFVLPVVVTLWIVRKLGRGFGLAKGHWAVPVVLAPVAWASFQFADLFED